MARMIAGVYDALRSAGADDDRDIADLRLEMSGVRTEMVEIRGDMRLLKRMVGFTMALVLGVLGTVL